MMYALLVFDLESQLQEYTWSDVVGRENPLTRLDGLFLVELLLCGDI